MLNVTVSEVDETIFPKICSIIILPVASSIAGLLPVILGKYFHQNRGSNGITTFDKVIAFFLFFGGGVLICTIFLHLLPEITETVDNLEQEQVLPTLKLAYPELVICGGFFLIFLIEEIMHSFLHSSSTSCDNSVLVMDKSDIFSSSKDLSENHDAVAKKHNADSNLHTSVDHTHLPLDPAKSIFRGLLTVLALSVHEFFEGLAVGLEPDASMVWYLLTAIVCHKTVLASFIGIQLVATQVKQSISFMYIIVFALTSPTGIAIGLYMSLTSPTDDTVAVISVTLQAIATGTLMYVCFMEVYGKQWRTYQLPGIVKVIASVIGFILMSTLQMVLSP